MTTRKSPAGGGASSDSSGQLADFYLNSTPRIEPLQGDEVRERDLLIELVDRGYRVAVQCTACGAWVSHPRSVARHIGPVCERRTQGGGAA
jgi:primosomal protein N'